VYLLAFASWPLLAPASVCPSAVSTPAADRVASCRASASGRPRARRCLVRRMPDRTWPLALQSAVPAAQAQPGTASLASLAVYHAKTAGKQLYSTELPWGHGLAWEEGREISRALTAVAGKDRTKLLTPSGSPPSRSWDPSCPRRQRGLRRDCKRDHESLTVT
jgi:hypothetical protein